METLLQHRGWVRKWVGEKRGEGAGAEEFTSVGASALAIFVALLGSLFCDCSFGGGLRVADSVVSRGAVAPVAPAFV